MTRQAIFSMLENSGHPCDVVLDLFAGSGALGIEALSRGAAWADFVDSSRECCTMIRQNLERASLADRAGIHCVSAHKADDALQRRYDVVFADPPYDDASTGALLEALSSGPLLTDRALVIVSHGDRHPLADNYGCLVIWKKRRYGDSHISIYQREEQSG